MTRSNKVVNSLVRKARIGREGGINRMIANRQVQKLYKPSKRSKELLTKAINSNNVGAARDQLKRIIPAARARAGKPPLSTEQLDREIASRLRFIFNK